MSDELLAARVWRAPSSKDVKPAELLRALAHDIESGKVKCGRVVVLVADTPEVGNWEFGVYRANASYDQELVMLELGKERCVRHWLRGGE